MPDDFDWSLGADTEGAAERTPRVAQPEERGAQVAEPNQLNVQAELETADEQAGEAASEQHEAGAAPEEAVADVDEGGASEDGGDGQDLILGKFKSVDDLVQSYQEAERRLSTQGNEVGQLRTELAELRGAFSQSQQQPSQQLTEDLVSQVDELAAQNPQGAAVWALENQPLLYNRVMQIWAAEDSLGASRFENALMREQLKQEMEEKFTQQYGPVRETVAEATQAAQFDTAWRTVAVKHADLATFADAMMEAAATAPELAAALQSGDVASKERLIDNLYWLAKGRQADSIAVAATDLGRRQQQQAATEKQSASVASGSSGQARGEKTNVEVWKEQILAAPSTSIVENLRQAEARR